MLTAHHVQATVCLVNQADVALNVAVGSVVDELGDVEGHQLLHVYFGNGPLAGVGVILFPPHISCDGDLVFSKHSEGRFPSEDEILEKLRSSG